jgi:hypothetical protein
MAAPGENDCDCSPLQPAGFGCLDIVVSRRGVSVRCMCSDRTDQGLIDAVGDWRLCSAGLTLGSVLNGNGALWVIGRGHSPCWLQRSASVS